MTILQDTIFTPRLKLRKVEETDIKQLIAWSNNKQAYGDYLTPEQISENTFREKVRSGATWTQKNRSFIIETKDGTAIGTINYWLRPECEKCGVVKVRIAETAERGKGYGTEAQKYLVIELFERLKLNAVEMYTDVNNKAQQRCLGKLGFELVNSLTYEDCHVTRLGHLYRIDSTQYTKYPDYKYHYE
ncbi:MAG: N-acetyltransferase [Desulfobulbaceae bacterium]|nr:MAG: N-acetyltransferase [Desulfobulbaceae bacterium]